MKLYTEEQIKEAMLDARISPSLKIDFLLGDYNPIELPSDDDICDEAESIAHNYFVMQRNHYQGLEEGAKRMAYWLIKNIKQQDNA
jgi:hypothetical protein